MIDILSHAMAALLFVVFIRQTNVTAASPLHKRAETRPPFTGQPATLNDVFDFYNPRPHNIDPMSEATGPALMAMVKCNGDWPKQLFREDPNDQDTWVITLHNPVYKTGVEMTAVEYPSEYESVPNMDSENENIPDLASRWWAGALYSHLSDHYDSYTESGEGPKYNAWFDKRYRGAADVRDNNLRETHFVMSALFMREVVITQKKLDDNFATTFKETVANSTFSPMLLLRPDKHSKAVMRTENAKVWLRGLADESGDESLSLENEADFIDATLIHLADTTEAFKGPSWYHHD